MDSKRINVVARVVVHKVEAIVVLRDGVVPYARFVTQYYVAHAQMAVRREEYVVNVAVVRYCLP